MTIALLGFTLYRTNLMLKADGFSSIKRAQMFKQGMKWLFAKDGIFTAMKKPFMTWYKKDFHPNQHPVIAQYDIWVETLERTGDPLQAGEALWHAGK
ncbi:hypothetical protein I6M69_14885 [Acinetobacter nosocomialis]|jgi:predicted metal-dependent hydrolase|nr:hypothetical protein [Acinetobacter baumannii]MBJ8465360.1 hypothetical protein [Acinetobacter nosocomialis]MBT1522686.1 hypothetical protein [Acinetobacter pittii]